MKKGKFPLISAIFYIYYIYYHMLYLLQSKIACIRNDKKQVGLKVL